MNVTNNGKKIVNIGELALLPGMTAATSDTSGRRTSVGRKMSAICIYSERLETLFGMPSVLYTAKSA